MIWRPYTACCQRHAGNPDAAVCPDCGNTLLRCMAFSECQSLVSPTQACPACVAPALMIDKGAVVNSKKGERFSVPLILLNASPARRPLWVKRIVRWTDGTADPLALTWERLDGGSERRFAVDTPPMNVGGTYTLELIVVVASRHKVLEETYAFGTSITVTVTSPDDNKAAPNIVFTGNTFGDDALVHSRLDVEAMSAAAEPRGLQDRTMLSLERAEKYELDEGIRGYRTARLRVIRSTEFGFSGFGSAERPPAGVAAFGVGRLALGRNSRTRHPEHNPAPNDVCLRVYDARTGAIDEPATMAISRHHFDLLVLNDRLCVQARATSGMQVNGSQLDSGDVLPLVTGDRIVPIPGRPDKLALQVSFAHAIDTVERVDIARTPAVR
ncbi:MAG: hypothetical protein IT183_05715 [Acidobacteria bacterium]|nr:hypothetical protein [Acidobacteriota bacterium]